MDKANALCCCRIETLRCQRIAPRLTHADGGDHVGFDNARDQADLHFGEAELRPLFRDGDIAA